MPDEPLIKVLPHRNRTVMFWVLLFVFLVTLPILIFYSSGNRIKFDADATNIVSLGGIYLTSEHEAVDVFLDEAEVRNRRLFRQAFYIQDVPAGTHRLHVQAEGLATWVKLLPVYPYIVTEALAFNMPSTPQLRLISELTDADGAAVYASSSALAELPGEIVNPVVFTASSTPAGADENPEYAFLEELFSTSSAPTSTLLQRYQQSQQRFAFQSELPTTTVATTTVEFQNMQLFERGGEVYARWIGSADNIPPYFCIRYFGLASTSQLYGEHVARAVAAQLDALEEEVPDGARICRDEIRIDRMGQDVLQYDFLPGSADIVLLQLEKGLYVTEIDDRAWQNNQLLYPGTGLDVLIQGGGIFVRDAGVIAEVLTALPQ